MTQPTTVEKYEVRNRWTGEDQFVAEIKWAFKNDAYLRGADLRGANLIFDNTPSNQQMRSA